MPSPIGLSAVTVPPGTLTPLAAIADRAAVAGFDPDRPMSLANYFRLCESLALGIGDESIQLSLRPLMLGTSDMIRDRLRGAASVRDMLEIIAQSYNVIHGGPFNRVRVARNELVFVVDDRGFPYTVDADHPFILFSIEALLVYIHVLIQSASASEEPLPLHSLRTRRGLADGPSPLALWGVPIAHGAQRFELHYDREAGSWPVDPASCPVLSARTIYGGIARALAAETAPAELAGDIVAETGAAIRDGLTSQDGAARHLGMSVATLRRRLVERGTSFRDERAKQLRAIADLRLRQGARIADIAEELGFSDGRSFARAYRGWTGKNPSEIRASQGD